MRWALLVSLLLGCSQDSNAIAIDVVTSPQRVGYFISPGPGCTCRNIETFPPMNGCTQFTDVGGPSCTCYPGDCLTHVTLLHGTTSIDGIDATPTGVRAFFPGDFTQPGLALRFEGCGADATVALPTQFPDAVAFAASTDGTQVSWPAVPSNGFLIADNGSFAGELCRAEPDAVAAPLHFPATELAVQALLGPIASSSGSISFQVWATN